MEENIGRLFHASIAESNKVDDSWKLGKLEEMKALAKPTILDSGDRTEFDTGAVRDLREGKGRCDLMPLDVVAEVLRDKHSAKDIVLNDIAIFQETGDTNHLLVALMEFGMLSSAFKNLETMLLETAIHFEEGAKKYGENNWQKGIPVRCYIDSAVRHYLKFRRGDKDEPHDRAFCWNIMCAIWTCKHMPELNEYRPKCEDLDMSKIVVKHNIPDDWFKPMEEPV